MSQPMCARPCLVHDCMTISAMAFTFVYMPHTPAFIKLTTDHGACFFLNTPMFFLDNIRKIAEICMKLSSHALM